MPIETDLGAKTFGMNDQALFAAWSGDHNPMHVSALAARRLVSGLPVVHGMHTVLEALARWAALAAPPARLQAEFTRPVNVGDTVRFAAQTDADGGRLTASVDGQLHMSLFLQHGTAPSPAAELPEGTALPALQAPCDVSPAAWLGQTHRLPPVQGTLPAAEVVAARWGRPAAEALGQLSTLVGMVCPGLHSIFSSFDLQPGAAEPAQRFRALRHEPRFRLMDIEVDGPWRGRVRAFVRPPPQSQPAMAALLDRFSPDAFVGRHSWVLGGSRGLGELTAKLIAAGGGTVTLTYATGRDDAQRVADEINAAGRGQAQVAQYEAGRTAASACCAQWPRPAAVFFFATPRIGRKRSAAFDARLLAEFMRCYAEEPAALALALEEWLQAEPAAPVVQLFHPSSVFVDELPLGMVEYAMAKAAGEVMARDLNKRLRRVQLHSPRLPRMLTDQTAGLLPSQAANAVDILQPLLAGLFQRP
jgi:NAD(P)-dependent dehydrogenase (short-subunit alcohol dehydrogenase family)